MLITGAKGHALEVFDVLRQNKPGESIFFFDNVSTEFSNRSIDVSKILRTAEELRHHFSKDPAFVLGTGLSWARRLLEKLCLEQGGQLRPVIAASSIISELHVQLGEGVNIMQGVIIHPEVTIGRGALINCRALVHHECTIGDYCEISPGAILTGNVTLGNDVFIGSGAVVLPRVSIGNNVVIAAGAVVRTDVPDNTMAAGVPAIIKKQLRDQ